jgi:hypothetical protein
MSALYGTLSGEKKDITKCGHKVLEGHIRGWDSGVRVVAKHTDNGDIFCIYTTGGSNQTKPDRLIASFSDTALVTY